MYVKLPEEDTEPGDQGKCGRLRMSMYGTRDAALNWSLEYAATLLSAGYVQGKSNPCLFFNKELGVSVMVHGDDFVAVGPRHQVEKTKKTLEDKYKLKTQELGKLTELLLDERELGSDVNADNGKSVPTR